MATDENNDTTEKEISSERDRLKGYFKNGALPTEEHFGKLIDSMALVGQIRDVEQPEELKLGRGDDVWSLAVGPDGELLIQAENRTNGTVHVDGTIEAEARVGEALTVPADRTWKRLMEADDEVGVYRIVAKIESVDPKPRDSFLRSLAGARSPRAAVLHAIATTSGSGVKPGLHVVADPKRRWWWTALMIIGLFGTTLQFKSPTLNESKYDEVRVIDGAPATITAVSAVIDTLLEVTPTRNATIEVSHAPDPDDVQDTSAADAPSEFSHGVANTLKNLRTGIHIVGFIAGLFALIRMVGAFLTNRILGIRWRRVGGSGLGRSAYALELRGDDFGAHPPIDIQYDITRLTK